MFDNTRDINRDMARQDAYIDDASAGSGVGPLVALLAIAVIVGGLFWFAPRTEQQVASNTPATQSTPAPAPAAPAPAVPVAPKQ